MRPVLSLLGLSSNGGRSYDLVGLGGGRRPYGESVAHVMCCRDWEVPQAGSGQADVEEVVAGPVAADEEEAAVAAAHAPV